MNRFWENASHIVGKLYKMTMCAALGLAFILLIVAGVSKGRDNVQNSIRDASEIQSTTQTLIKRYYGSEFYGNFLNDSERLFKKHYEIQHLVSHGDPRQHSTLMLIVVYQKKTP